MKQHHYAALRRLLVIDRELRRGTYPNADRLAELTETNARTIRRDFEFLQTEYGAPIQYNAGRKGWEYRESTYKLPALLITEGELLALFIAGQGMRLVQGTPYVGDLQRALQKITEFLPDEISIRCETLSEASSFHQSVTTLQDLGTFRQLAEAVLHQRQMQMEYFTASRGADSVRVIDPYHLACIDGEWFLFAYCHLRGKVRMFKPPRIRTLTETGSSFERPADFSIGEYLDGTFRVVAEEGQPLQEIRLRFAASAAKYVREKWYHPSQSNEFHADGGMTVTLQLRSLVEVRRWVLSWGSECQVLEPAALRDDIRREAEKVLEQRNETGLERLPSRRARHEKRADRQVG